MNDLRRVRLEAGLTQARLARLSGCALRTILYVESGRRRTRIETQRKLLRVLGIPFHRRSEIFPVGSTVGDPGR